MKNVISTLLSLAFMSISCHNTNAPETHNAAAAKPLTKEDSLYKKAIALHDEAMPKMGKLIGLQKTIQLQIDSVNLINHPGNSTKDYQKQLTRHRAMLKKAETEMNDWMEHFNPDPQITETARREAYFTEQAEKAQIMRNDLFAALDSAAILLKK